MLAQGRGVSARAVLNTGEAHLKLHNHINLLIYTAALYKNRRVLIRLTILNKYLIEKVFGLVHSSSFGLILISLGPRCSWSNIAITSSAWIRSCKRGRKKTHKSRASVPTLSLFTMTQLGAPTANTLSEDEQCS